MMRKILGTSACLAFVLSGCGGGSGTTPQLPATSSGPNNPGATSSVSIVIAIPKAGTSSSARKPAFVSPSTQSITVQVDSGSAVTQNLLPASPNCSSAGANYPLDCTVTVSANAGSHTLTFVTYDQQNAAGNQLSANSIVVNFVAGQTPAVPVVLAGVPAAIQVLPMPSGTIVANNTLTSSAGLQWVWGVPQMLVITSADADGNYIVGPGAPALSVTVSGAPSGSGIAIAPAPNNNPNDFTLSSTGGGDATLSITATPSFTGSPVTATFALASVAKATTITIGVPWNYIGGVAGDTVDGNLYVSNECQVFQMTTAGVFTAIAGTASPCGTTSQYVDGAGAAAQIGYALSPNLAYDSHDGNLYMADTANCAVRQVTTAGVVTTIAGSLPPTVACGFADGTGSAARFGTWSSTYTGVTGMAYDSAADALYVADNCAIRQVTAAGTVTTIAGSTPPNPACGHADGTGSLARMQTFIGIAYDSTDGNLYFADRSNCAVRQMTPGGTVTTIAGYLGCGTRGIKSGIVDGTGSAAEFKSPSGIAYDPDDGYLYVADSCWLRRVSTSGVVFTVAGPDPTSQYNSACAQTQLDGIGANAALGQPTGGIVYDHATGMLYVSGIVGMQQVQL
ncbi:MAG TPA: hypothetical protein VMW12_13895 [Candidatus Dormibacteraeota bacterium]|nr:hypothetical protein [Candidatus Dormibacteraeota bacterium]